MPRPTLLPICDEDAEIERHRWPWGWQDGDTCQCGRWYLRRGNASEGFAHELERTPQVEEDEP